VPPAQLRELRLIARQRQKLVGLLSSEKNRMHKVLTDAGIRRGETVDEGSSTRQSLLAPEVTLIFVDLETSKPYLGANFANDRNNDH
jgi:hypothetical protein